jgi:hypothetical protein
MFKDVLMPIFIVLGITAILVALLNLEDDGSVVGNASGPIKTLCLNGVKYYDGYNTLAPAVDAETLTFIRCEVK